MDFADQKKILQIKNEFCRVKFILQNNDSLTNYIKINMKST